MNPEPTGKVVDTATGRDVILSRDLNASPADAWSWIVDPAKLGKWFGPWTGDGRPGGRIEVAMSAEEGSPLSPGEILSCDPGRSCEVRFIDESDDWHLEVTLEPSGEHTRIVLIQHLDQDASLGSSGAGWEYYLDRLVAAMADAPMPEFDLYWPNMGPYYEEQA